MSTSSVSQPFWRAFCVPAILGVFLTVCSVRAQAFLPAAKQPASGIVSVQLRVKNTTPEAVVRVLEEVAPASFGRVHLTPPLDVTESQVGVHQGTVRARACPADAFIVRAGVFDRTLHGCVQREGSAVHLALQVFERSFGRWPDLVCGLPSQQPTGAGSLQSALAERFRSEGWLLNEWRRSE